MKVLLGHANLANYNRELVNWQLDDKMYRDYVLSPVITGKADEQLNWRRPLWEEFYPRIRHELSPAEAANIVLRHLRERVTISTAANLPHDVPEIWSRQTTDETGFETFMPPHSARLASPRVWIPTTTPNFGTATSGKPQRSLPFETASGLVGFGIGRH